jgi:PAS domain S-box-containing protein
LVLISATVLIVMTAHRLDRLLYGTYIQNLRSQTHLELVEVREGFGKIIQSQSLVLRELATYIGENPTVDQATFARRVRNIPGVNDFLVSVGGAPDLVISLIVPKEGNEGALGLDYRKNKEQLPAVLRMLASGSELITGPVNLVQGGKGLVLRAPVYLPNTSSYIDEEVQRELWGAVSLVLNYDKFIEQSGISDATETYDLFIDTVQHPDKRTEDALFGDSTLKGKAPVTLQFDFAFQNWIIYAVPKGGWPETYPDQWKQRGSMALAGLALLGALVYILWLSQTRRVSKVLLKSGIEAMNDGFIMFDEDDRLILYNTKYQEIYGLTQHELRPGTPYVDIMNAWIANQHTQPEEEARTRWLGYRQTLTKGREATDFEHHIADGRVIKASNYPLDNGGSVGLRVDITELTRAKVAAEAASKAKTDFMGLLSHELRTPLTVMMGVAQLLKNARMLRSSKALIAAYEAGEVPSAQARAMLDDLFAQLDGLMQKMNLSGEHLKHLISELLDIAKIESGSLVVEPAICNVTDIVDPVFNQLITLSKRKGLDLQLMQGADSVFADELRLRQILFNLIGNAIKFTDNGFVRLEVKPDADTVRFEVSDSGVGICMEELENVFDLFYQVDSTATRRAGGTGMGLAISRRLAVLQNGSLTVTSKPGKGSCFVLVVPRSNPAT